jgi:hypothetical protein
METGAQRSAHEGLETAGLVLVADSFADQGDDGVWVTAGELTLLSSTF